MKFTKIFSVLTLTALSTVACSRAETLAELEPPQVAFDAQNPTWNNGIANLVKERCASCHGARKEAFVPASTPLLDFTKEDEFRSVRFRSIARMKDLANPMPPRYADPISESEAEVLIRYLEN